MPLEITGKQEHGYLGFVCDVWYGLDLEPCIFRILAFCMVSSTLWSWNMLEPGILRILALDSRISHHICHTLKLKLHFAWYLQHTTFTFCMIFAFCMVFAWYLELEHYICVAAAAATLGNFYLQVGNNCWASLKCQQD